MKKYANWLSALYITLFSLGYSLLLTTNPLSTRFWRGDSSMFIYFGKAMRAGKLPYRDIFDHKGPMIFVLNYLGTFLPGRVTGVYWIELLCLVAGFWGVYCMVRLWLNRPLSLVTVTIYGITLARFLENGNLTEAYALPLWIWTLYVFVRVYVKDVAIRFGEAVAIGVCVMFVFLLRANMVLSWLPLALVLFVHLCLKKDWPLLRRTVLGFLLGLMSFGVVVAIWLYSAGIWDAFVYQAFTFNFQYVNQGNFFQPLQKFTMEMLRDYSMIWVVIANGVFLLKRKKQMLGLFVGLAGTFVLTLYSASLSGRAYLHYLMLMYPIIACYIAYVLSYFACYKKYGLIGLIGLLIYIPHVREFKQDIVAQNAWLGHFGTAKTVAENRQEVLSKEVADYIKQHTEPEDTIYVLYDAGRLYLLSERLSNTRFFSLPAVDLNEFDGLREEFFESFEGNLPRAIVLKQNALKDTKQPFVQGMQQLLAKGYKLSFENERSLVFIRE
ncbi:MAG: hypothetical protein Q4B80_06425 [Aerococcaceae bacterium]|nr:hypothetical protein [Aerococcaceae bacterium]